MLSKTHERVAKAVQFVQKYVERGHIRPEEVLPLFMEIYSADAEFDDYQFDRLQFFETAGVESIDDQVPKR